MRVPFSLVKISKVCSPSLDKELLSSGCIGLPLFEFLLGSIIGLIYDDGTKSVEFYLISQTSCHINEFCPQFKKLHGWHPWWFSNSNREIVWYKSVNWSVGTHICVRGRFSFLYASLNIHKSLLAVSFWACSRWYFRACTWNHLRSGIWSSVVDVWSGTSYLHIE